MHSTSGMGKDFGATESHLNSIFGARFRHGRLHCGRGQHAKLRLPPPWNGRKNEVALCVIVDSPSLESSQLRTQNSTWSHQGADGLTCGAKRKDPLGELCRQACCDRSLFRRWRSDKNNMKVKHRGGCSVAHVCVADRSGRQRSVPRMLRLENSGSRHLTEPMLLQKRTGMDENGLINVEYAGGPPKANCQAK